MDLFIFLLLVGINIIPIYILFIDITKMLSVVTIIIIFLLLLFVFVNYILPVFKRHSQLQKDYQNISFLPLSSIPFLGNLHLIDKRPHVFYQLLCRMAKECQDQDKGIFCLWYALWPMTFLCTAKGLEVCTCYSYQQTIFLFN